MEIIGYKIEKVRVTWLILKKVEIGSDTVGVDSKNEIT